MDIENGVSKVYIVGWFGSSRAQVEHSRISLEFENLDGAEGERGRKGGSRGKQGRERRVKSGERGEGEQTEGLM